MKEKARQFFELLQDVLCARFEALDAGARFREDRWEHPAGGGGKTRILVNGNIFEKGGINFSAVSSALSDRLAARMKVEPQEMFATGISLVLHPADPFVPAVHMNLRYIELEHGDRWFGGGVDLSPCYLILEDARHFHAVLKAACDRHDPEYYPRFKQWCDEYFFLPHRSESRGIGGIFFDYLRRDPAATMLFVRDVGMTFPGAYQPIVEMRSAMPWTPEQKRWQLLRRGRYAEFNLLFDRGTLFGLETGGRAESILMSLPPEVLWAYNVTPSPGSPEEQLVKFLQHPQSWI